MALDNKAYVPTLAVRASEMNGLGYLPAASKDRFTPCFLLAPWANSNFLERTITRIEKAFPNRNYFLDIDRDYQFTDIDSGPQQELVRLMDPTGNYSNWIKFVQEHPRIWPCIQSRGQSRGDLRKQIEAFQELGRTYCMRIVRDRIPENLLDIIASFSAAGSSDFAVILEGGWTSDPLSQAAWFSGLLGGSLQAIDATVPVVVSCTSMPKMFTSFNDDTPITVPFNNRILVDQIERTSNRARVIYGDWGSTRPRERGGFANRPLDRVDYPTVSAWHIARNKEAEWNFADAARAITTNSVWNGSLGIWGEEMIENTTINAALGIDTPQKNVAARVNIHLHRQAFFDQLPSGPALDEAWED